MDEHMADMAQALTMLREWLPSERWEGMFTPEQLAVFAPKRGSRGLTPTLEVLIKHREQYELAVVILDTDEWNIWERRTKLLEQIGGAMAARPGVVLAFRIASEAWMRAFSEAEAAIRVREGRSVSSYDDKREIVMCFGWTLDGRMASATAPLHRDKSERIRAVGKWQVRHHDQGDPEATQMPLLAYAWDGYRKAVLARQKKEG